MWYALDTNVSLGFTFCPDKHYPPANNFISNTEKDYIGQASQKLNTIKKFFKINQSLHIS